jgi:hypothetical protein
MEPGSANRGTLTRRLSGLTVTPDYTGADLPQTQAEIREGARSKLIYIGGGLILCGALVIGVLKYPTPGALVIGSGVLLITLHQYPWIGWVSIGLCVVGGGIYYGHEIGERKPVPK